MTQIILLSVSSTFQKAISHWYFFYYKFYLKANLGIFSIIISIIRKIFHYVLYAMQS